MTITNNEATNTEIDESAQLSEVINDTVDHNWSYIGSDQFVHGRYASTKMQNWLEQGFFDENLMVNAENDQQFYCIKDFKRLLNGDCPFKKNIASFESLKPKQENSGQYYNEVQGLIPGMPGNAVFHGPIPNRMPFGGYPMIPSYGFPGMAPPNYLVASASPYPMDYSQMVPENMNFQAHHGFGDNLNTYSPASSDLYDENNHTPNNIADSSTDTSDAPWQKGSKKVVMVDSSTSTNVAQTADAATQTVYQIEAARLTQLLQTILGFGIEIIN
uniref:GYF domain-containing protein n=1 Tax=Rhabditophanes sp. KR3021 TaxID=114890 RepID=A0AC35U3K8_9BILA